MDDKSVDRLLEATKEAPGAETLDFSKFDDDAFGNVRAKRALGNSIAAELKVCRALKNVVRPKNRKESLQLYSDLRDSINQARALLDVDRNNMRLIGMFYPLNQPDSGTILANLETAADQAVELLTDQPGFEEPNPRFLHLVVAALSIVFERHLGRPAGFTKDDGVVDGPYIRFADTALWENDITKTNGERYTYATIAKALTDSRKQRLHGT